MRGWTQQRRGEFLAHCALFGVPFVISIAASCWFWTQHSGNLLAGIGSVVILEAIVFSVFVLHLAGIRTTIAWTRHGLPILSGVGMFEAFYRLFEAHNSPTITLAIASLFTVVLIAYLFFTKRGIERAVFAPDITPAQRVYRRMEEAQQAWLMDRIDALTFTAPSYLLPRQADYPAPVQIHEDIPAARVYTCKHCGESGLTAAENMTHGRLHKKYGTCKREE